MGKNEGTVEIAAGRRWRNQKRKFTEEYLNGMGK